MTDNEIIKALECHKSNSLLDCEKCPLYTKKLGFEKCHIELFDSLYDLINRQKAEIERLQEYYKLYFERERTIKELQENIEHLQNKIVMYEKEIESSTWDLPPMGGFHDD